MPPHRKTQARLVIAALQRKHSTKSWLFIAKWVCRARTNENVKSWAHLHSLLASPALRPYL